MISGAEYVGSTTVLWERLLHYVKNHTGQLRKILADIDTTGVENFTVRVVSLPPHLREMRFLHA